MNKERKSFGSNGSVYFDIEDMDERLLTSVVIGFSTGIGAYARNSIQGTTAYKGLGEGIVEGFVNYGTFLSVGSSTEVLSVTGQIVVQNIYNGIKNYTSAKTSLISSKKSLTGVSRNNSASIPAMTF